MSLATGSLAVPNVTGAAFATLGTSGRPGVETRGNREARAWPFPRHAPAAGPLVGHWDSA